MRFAFTEDQVAFRDAVRDLLDKECPPEVVRAAWPDGAPGGAVWSRLADMGVLSVAVPERNGGLGLDALDWVLLAEEAGYAALPHPFSETVGVVGPLGITGSTVATDLGGPVIAFAMGADRLVLRRAAELVLVDREAVDLAPEPTVDGSLGAGRIGAVPATGEVVAAGDEVALTFDRGVLGAAAQLVGLAQRMLDLTVAYVGERRQFGAPVGSFQAVKHHLADALMHLSFARPAVYRAAYSVAHDLATRERDVSMAKAMASDTARLVGAKALQCHGAIGYTVEYDLHLYLKRAWALAAMWGTSAWHRDRVGKAIGV